MIWAALGWVRLDHNIYIRRRLAANFKRTSTVMPDRRNLRWITTSVVFLLIVLAGFSPPPNENSEIADFTDIAQQSGLAMVNIFGGKFSTRYILESTGTGVAIFDYDNDGWPDAFLVNGTWLESLPGREAPTNHLYHNNQDGTFTDVTVKAGLQTTGWGQGVCVGDYDNNGWEDLYVTYYGANRLYHNRVGTFEEVGQESGVVGNGKSWSSGCAFLDYDRDGYLDIVVASYASFDLSTALAPGAAPTCLWKGIAVFCGPRGLRSASNLLYRNLGNGKFENVTLAARFDQTMGHYCFSVSPLDYDNDGWPDIYLACDSTPSILYRNNRDGTFTDDGIMSGVAYNEEGREQAGMGSAVADYDGDGNLDLFRTNFSDDTSTLYHNDGKGNFSDVTYPAGIGVHTQYLGWGVMFFDFDNDGWPDLVLANGHVYPEVDSLAIGIQYQEPKLLYHNSGKGTFKDVSQESGPGITTPASGRGLAIGDLWNDGHLSVLIANRNAAPNLLVNQRKYSNHWIAIRTVGTRSNRDGIGTRLLVKTVSRILVDEVRSGSSYISNSDMRVHFGLGTTSRIEYLEVHWPSGLSERFDSLPIDAIWTAREGSGRSVEAHALPTR
jgi:enediyne biosynthesis protein E4